jgi:hypothetical protein
MRNRFSAINLLNFWNGIDGINTCVMPGRRIGSPLIKCMHCHLWYYMYICTLTIHILFMSIRRSILTCMRIRVQQKASYSFHFIYIPMHDHTFPNHKTFLLYHDSKRGTRSKDTISRIILENIAVGIIIVIIHLICILVSNWSESTG